VIVASDHGGFALKGSLIQALEGKGVHAKDMGCFSEESVDYPKYAFAVAEAISKSEADRGVLVCTSGIGMSIAANKVAGARAALCYFEMAAMMARSHNNANILVIGARFVDTETAIRIMDVFLETEFDGGRHKRRMDMVDAYLETEEDPKENANDF
jgi:ribose 5-phosphate isomerase B